METKELLDKETTINKFSQIPNKGESFFFFTIEGIVAGKPWEGSKTDFFIFNFLGCYKDKASAEAHYKLIIA